MVTGVRSEARSVPEMQVSATAAERVAFGAGATSLALVALLHVVQPDVDPAWVPVSAYALGRGGWLMTAAFLAWAVSAISLAVALRGHVPTRAGRAGLVFLVVGAVGALLGGVFPMDPITTPPGAGTTTGAIHNVASILGDGFPIAAALLAWSLVRHDARWARFRTPLVLATLAAWIGVITFMAALIIFFPEDGQLGPEAPIGWPNRFMIVALVGWLMVAAWIAARVSGDATSRGEPRS